MKMLIACMAVVAVCSCAEYPLVGSVSYRDPESGAKGGINFRPGHAPRASVRVPVYDEAGRLIGMGELSGPLGREVEPAK